MARRKPRSRKQEQDEAERALRYLSAEQLAEDFKTPAERRAVLAVFEWISLNGVCAWPLERPGEYRTWADDTPHTKIVLDAQRYANARSLLALALTPEPPARAAAGKQR
jgi:hypothetical protein